MKALSVMVALNVQQTLVLAVPLQIRFTVNGLGKQQRIVHMFGPLNLIQDPDKTLGFSLAQP